MLNDLRLWMFLFAKFDRQLNFSDLVLFIHSPELLFFRFLDALLWIDFDPSTIEQSQDFISLLFDLLSQFLRFFLHIHSLSEVGVESLKIDSIVAISPLSLSKILLILTSSILVTFGSVILKIEISLPTKF